MAIMYPKNIELYDATLSERKIFKALQNQLPDTYTVFYAVQWVDSINGQKKESESDFLIFSESEGFLTCEVKGGKGYKKVDNRFVLIEGDGERRLSRSPMEQAEESSRYFYKLYMQEYNEQFNGIYGSISLFPFYPVNDPVLLDHRPKEVVFDIQDVENLNLKIRKAFLFYKSKRHIYGSLSKNQRNNFKNMINKNIASKASAGSIIEAKEFEINIVNRIQDNLVFFLRNHSRSFISGGAGTGKTWIAYKFAKKAPLEGKKTLLTTFNNQLIKMFKKLLNGYKNIDVISFDNLIIKDGLKNKNDTEELLYEYEGVFFEKYDCIIVDEGQDFDQFQAMIISIHLLNHESEFRVFYDLTQNIYDKEFKNGFDISVAAYSLRENLRNTSSIYDWASEKTNLGKEVVTNQIIGPAPVSFVFKKKYDLIKYIETEIKKLVDFEKVPLESIVILTDHDCYEMFKQQTISRWVCIDNAHEVVEGLKISLVEDFKGLESNIIFYVHDYATPENYNYVAFTRAKYYLYELIFK